MTTLPDPNWFQKLRQFGALVLKGSLTLTLVSVLFCVWILTEPFFRVAENVARRRKLNLKIPS